MDVLIAPDKFKGSLNALEVCKALEKGVKINPNINNIFLCPLADGGDGSLDILNYYKDFLRKPFPQYLSKDCCV